MTFLGIVLLTAALLCSLVAGFLLAFAIVVMPGIAHLDDRGFIRAFQVIDRVIQNHQPVFMLLWAGSALTLLAATLLGVFQLPDGDRMLIIIAALIYFLGVQLPTVRINVPLNNELQKLHPTTMSESTYKHARDNFERTWNRWNLIRTACSVLVSALLLIVLVRL
jgi:uncharacterized membrane protein